MTGNSQNVETNNALKIAVLETRVKELEKDTPKLEAVIAFQNRLIGYAIAASAAVSLAAEYLWKNK